MCFPPPWFSPIFRHQDPRKSFEVLFSLVLIERWGHERAFSQGQIPQCPPPMPPLSLEAAILSWTTFSKNRGFTPMSPAKKTPPHLAQIWPFLRGGNKNRDFFLGLTQTVLRIFPKKKALVYPGSEGRRNFIKHHGSSNLYRSPPLKLASTKHHIFSSPTWYMCVVAQTSTKNALFFAQTTKQLGIFWKTVFF